MLICPIISNAKFDHLVKRWFSPLYLSFLWGDALSSREDYMNRLCPEDFELHSFSIYW